jgi:iron only hydrogenase large subunit-like protein
MTGIVRDLVGKQSGIPISDISVVYLTSCTASKTETAGGHNLKQSKFLPDYALTTREVYRLIRLFGIQVENLTPDSHEDILNSGNKSGYLSAISGGFIEMLIRILQVRNPDIKVSSDKLGKMRGIRDFREIAVESNSRTTVIASVSSIAQFESYLKEIRNKNKKIDLIEVMACQHGCINGGGQPCRGVDRNLRNRLKGILEWDEKFSGIQTKEFLEPPEQIMVTAEDCAAVFTHRPIIK